MAALTQVQLPADVVLATLKPTRQASGKSVASFASDLPRARDADASFIDCVAWNKAAELLAEYAPKGKQIGITGRLQRVTWEKDDIKRKATEAIIDQIPAFERR